MTFTKKCQVDEEWWEVTNLRETSRRKQLQGKLLDKPLPTSIAELKNHPLYALKRLLRYEAL